MHWLIEGLDPPEELFFWQIHETEMFHSKMEKWRNWNFICFTLPVREISNARWNQIDCFLSLKETHLAVKATNVPHVIAAKAQF